MWQGWELVCLALLIDENSFDSGIEVLYTYDRLVYIVYAQTCFTTLFYHLFQTCMDLDLCRRGTLRRGMNQR